MENWIVLGLSGITNGGKTSVALKLKEKFPTSLHIKQDDYFLPIEDERHEWVKELGHINWELLSSLNIDKMVCDVKKILQKEISKPTLIMLDGFLLFNDSRTSELCQYKFYFDVDYETCKNRRLKRDYDPPDVPCYFEKIVWPEAVKAKKYVIDNVKDVLILDGTLPIDQLVNIVLKHIKI